MVINVVTVIIPSFCSYFGQCLKQTDMFIWGGIDQGVAFCFSEYIILPLGHQNQSQSVSHKAWPGSPPDCSQYCPDSPSAPPWTDRHIYTLHNRSCYYRHNSEIIRQGIQQGKLAFQRRLDWTICIHSPSNWHKTYVLRRP